MEGFWRLKDENSESWNFTVLNISILRKRQITDNLYSIVNQVFKVLLLHFNSTLHFRLVINASFHWRICSLIELDVLRWIKLILIK